MTAKYLIYGAGISGISALRYLDAQDFQVAITDDNPEILAKLSQNATVISPNQVKNYLDPQTKVIFAPGIPLYHPKRHEILDFDADLVADIEAFYLLHPQKNYIGVTGTNGKSTCVALIDFIFNEIGQASLLGGNIGDPVFSLPQNPDFDKIENITIEASSFQLDLMQKTHFDVAAITNITPDHIERHGDFDGYFAAKKRIFANQNAKDYAIINIDDENLAKMRDFAANLVAISTKTAPKNSVSVIDGFLRNKIGENDEKFDLSGTFLQGEHNFSNIALAFACVFCTLSKKGQISRQIQEKIIHAIKKFRGLEHRMQILGTKNNITFINDSKATNAISAQKSLETFENIFWILGGVAKENGLLGLEKSLKNLKKAYLIGEASQEFAKFLKKNDVIYEECFKLDNAFEKSYQDAQNFGGKMAHIVLSPACASYDQWQNFQQRGNYFCKLFTRLTDFS